MLWRARSVVPRHAHFGIWMSAPSLASFACEGYGFDTKLTRYGRPFESFFSLRSVTESTQNFMKRCKSCSFAVILDPGDKQHRGLRTGEHKEGRNEAKGKVASENRRAIEESVLCVVTFVHGADASPFPRCSASSPTNVEPAEPRPVQN